MLTGERLRRRGRLVAAAAILLAAVNLRLAVTSVGPVLTEIRHGLGMSATVAGLLTSVPVVCFASFGLAAPALARRAGAARVITAGLVALAAGLAVRPFAADTALFLLLSVVSLAGIAVVNVLLPVIVKEHFPTQVGAMTGLYSVALNVGATTAAAATVPLTRFFGGDWRLGLAGWAVLAVLAVPSWLPLLRHQAPTGPEHTGSPHPNGPGHPDGPEHPNGPGHRGGPPAAGVPVGRSPVAWALAIYFGMQSTAAYVIIGWLPQIYRDAGISAEQAGVLFAVTSFLGVPLSFVLSAIAGRLRSQSGIAAALCAFGLAGYGGLWWSPAAAPWLWAVLLGVANTAFPLALTMIALRGRTPDTVVRLSAFAQGIGYLLAIPGPILVGFLHDRTGGWRAPLGLVLVLLVPQLLAGLAAGRDRQV